LSRNREEKKRQRRSARSRFVVPASLGTSHSTSLGLWKKKLPPLLQASPADLWHGDEAEAHLSQLAVLENFAAHGMFVKFTDEEAAALEGRALAIALSASKDVAKHGTTAATLRVAAPAASRGIGGAGGFGAPLPVSLPAEPLGRDGAEAVLKSLRPSGAVVDLPSSGSSRPGSAARRLLGSVLGGGKKGASVPAEAGEGGSVEAAASSKPFDEAEVAAAVAARRAEIEAELARKLAADEAASIRRREREEAAEAKRIAAEKAAEERRVAAEALAAKKREEARLRAEAQGAKQKEAFEAAERKRRELELKKEQAAKAKAEADEARRVAAAEAAKEKEEAARVAAIAKAEADKVRDLSSYFLFFFLSFPAPFRSNLEPPTHPAPFYLSFSLFLSLSLSLSLSLFISNSPFRKTGARRA